MKPKILLALAGVLAWVAPIAAPRGADDSIRPAGRSAETDLLPAEWPSAVRNGP